MRNGRLNVNCGLGRNCPRFICEGGGREGGCHCVHILRHHLFSVAAFNTSAVRMCR